jgi:hypothetical protein
MTTAVSIQFLGLQQAYLEMELWSVELGAAIEAAGQNFGEFVADVVRAEVPVVTGTLAGSVRSEAIPAGVSVSIGEDVPYAGWIEFGGTRGREWIPEGRYLYPTARAAEPEWAVLAIETANETARSFPWSIPVF